MPKPPDTADDRPQIDKFRDLARELEAEESEEAFADAVKRVAKSNAGSVPDRD